MGITVPTVVTESIAPAPIRAPLQSVKGAGVDLGPLAQGLDVFAAAKANSDLQLSQIRISAAETDILNRWNARLNEDKDAFYKDGGQSGFERLEPSMQELDDIVSDGMGGLKDNTERRILKDALALRRMNHRTKMSLTAFDWRQDWDKSTATANRQAQYEAALNDPSPENLRLSEKRIIDETDAISKIDNESKEGTELNAATAVSGMYTAVIESIMSQPGRLGEANAIFERYKEEGKILPSDLVDLSVKLREFTVLSEARENVEDISNRVDENGEPLTLKGQQEAADNEIDDPEILELTRQKLSTRDAQNSQGETRSNEENHRLFGDGVRKRPYIREWNNTTQEFGPRESSLDSMIAKFPNRWLELSDTQKQNLRNLDARLQQGLPIETNLGIYNELAGMSDGQLAGVDLMNHVGDLADREWFGLQNRQNSIRNGTPTEAPDSITTALKKMTQLKGSDFAASADGFLAGNEIDERIREWAENNGGQEPKGEDLNKIVYNTLRDVMLPDVPGFFGSAFQSLLGAVGVDAGQRTRSTSAFTMSASKVPGKSDVPTLFITEFEKEYFNIKGIYPAENAVIDAYVSFLESPEKYRGISELVTN